MKRPKLEKKYTFVQVEKGQVTDWLYFTAHRDGSGGIDISPLRENRELVQRMEVSWIQMDGNWEEDFEKLQAEGWVEVNEAEKDGVIPRSWEPGC